MFRERVTKTEDALEGPRSFKEKRSPEWKAE
jgi:1,4-dihydroxy-2-naphthoyl-CoA synthase